ncbi:selenocysteine-specific translation elongation factor [Nonomuraea turkmeniaca]|uniref:Selenocysteine-specific elongation factor n=1 Tax=Nonomuraea turkmeniaca TaxID=103838 RepID=A0A5S4FM70_9ACTN|nr:selenocysteine-specific translation elongation factor [Nonomuraea turkmeniaca]TMR21826.1 selenocysteine-specific translation elongation factor [Nonomuraea turkmeniaca]
MYVIATAGHVDHGKSTLVRALTGIEPDRWAEERRRGMTIDLGFAWTTLPSGRRLAFVDVPGHERFVTNMLAGLGPVPAVMFVLAADQGWQAQSQEHWEAIEALGVDRGLLVVTRCDLMDPALAVEEARERITSWPLATVSGSTGEGLDDLRRGLDLLISSLPAPDPGAPVRLWIDRGFTITGAGTVVTGTLAAGTLRVGDTLVLDGERVRVKALQVTGEPVDEVAATARVAVNLRGVERDRAVRGTTLLTPDAWLETDVVDVRLDVRQDGGLAPREAVLHIGSASVPARVRPIGPARTGAGAARLTLARALPLRVGDRALLRCSGRPIMSVLVLDVRPPALRRRGAAGRRAAQLAPFAVPDTAGEAGGPVPHGLGDAIAPTRGVPDAATVLGWRGVARWSELAAMGCDAGGLDVPGAGDWVVDPGWWERLAERLRALVAEQPGIPVDAARTALGLPARDLVEALVKSCPPLHVSDGRIDGDGVPAEVVAAVERLRAELAGTPYLAPEAARLPALGLNRRAVALAARAGLVLRLADDVVLLPGADSEAARILAKLPRPFTAGDARAALATNRRVVIPLLEHLDRLHLTRRIDDRLRVVVDGEQHDD